ncbi:MAG: rhomboid family intramembrane serine protease [Nitrospira sp.]|nr:rhomboid family intramembrane serine protease [bacterium]MBL7049149.1 rhomboid family intramembrane serine protease [Nitrospira sp.]
MIPFKDDNPAENFPIVTISIIVLNVLVFLWQYISPRGVFPTTFLYGAVPHLLLTGSTVQPIHPFMTIITSMFMHGGFLHLFVNMLYLWIFGNNIEDKLGIVRFIVFYIMCGAVAVYSHALTDSTSMVPMIGASGAVSGILGAYILLYPKARVHVLIFLVIFIEVIKLPAYIVIGFWIAIQLINGILSSGLDVQGGVAWFAHIGGFLAGLIISKIFFSIKER